MDSNYKQVFWPAASDNVGLAIYTCGLQKCTPGHSWGPGVRDHYLLHFVVGGKGYLQIGDAIHTVTKGMLFFIKPSQLVHYWADRDDPWEYYWVGFNGAYATRLLPSLPFSDQLPLHACRETTPMAELFLNLFSARGMQPENQVSMVGYLCFILARLLGESPQALPQKPNAGGQYVLEAIEYIQFNYSHNISVDDIARAVGISRSHLYRVFMHNLDCSPIDYLTRCRIDEACCLLRDSDLSIAQVAASVGFLDQFYFSRVFKKAKGVPPSRYAARGDDPAGEDLS